MTGVVDGLVVIELLPARGLDQSLLLPILVGLLVVLLFTETLGWVFAGAVVPGYLASVLIIQPVTGVLVVFESLVTLAIASTLARGLSKTDAWTRFFGRERFFLILAISLLVRVHDHAWFAPWAIASLDAQLGTALETQQEFYSVGLVLVPLTANMLWKPSLPRGLVQLAVEVGVTYLVIAYVLLPHTNLTLSSVELDYEDAALDFVGHAKAHIILLSAALLAAQLNLSWGWDFNGILVPALLALLWLTPLKLIATVGEAIVVLVVVRGFLRLPWIRQLDFEGPRKISLVFALAFAWKLALGYTLAPLFPELVIRDTYGFGYLLSSLLTVKMLGRKSIRAVLLPSLTASATGFALGSLAGFVLDFAAPKLPPLDARLAEANASTSTRLVTTPLGVMALARLQIEVATIDPRPPSQAELHALRRLWARLARLPAGRDHEHADEQLELAARAAAGLGYALVDLGEVAVGGEPGLDPTAPVHRRWWALVERDGIQRRGFGTALIAPGARGPVLVVPMPVSEGPLAELAAVACRRVDCRAVLVAGRERGEPGTRVHPRPLELAIAAFASASAGSSAGSTAGPGTGAPVLILRGDAPAPADPSAAVTRVHPLRGYHDVGGLGLGAWELDWRPRPSLVRPPPGAGAWLLVRADPSQIAAAFEAGAGELLGPIAVVRAGERSGATGFDEALMAVLSERYVAPPRASSRERSRRRYVPPSTAELQLLEQAVVEPLVDWAHSPRPAHWPDGGDPAVPDAVAVWARLLDYELVELGDCRSRREPAPACAVALRERTRPVRAGWGTLLIRRNRGSLATTIEVPRPLHELETWRVGAELWQLSEAEALLIADVDEPEGPLLTTADPNPTHRGNLRTPFQAIHQAIDRRSIRGRAGPVVQIRGLAAARPIDSDVVLGLGQPALAAEQTRRCAANLDPRLAALIRAWGPCRVADGSPDLYPLTGAGSPQLESSRELRNREVRVLWLSAGLRDRFRPREALAQLRGLVQAGYAVTSSSEIEALLAPLAELGESEGPGRAHATPRPEAGAEGFERAINLAVAYAETGNLHTLRALQELAQAHADVHVDAGLGRDWGRPYLRIDWRGPADASAGPQGSGGERALVSLDPQLGGIQTVTLDPPPADPSHRRWRQTAIVRVRAAALTRPQVIRVLGLGDRAQAQTQTQVQTQAQVQAHTTGGRR